MDTTTALNILALALGLCSVILSITAAMMARNTRIRFMRQLRDWREWSENPDA